MFDFITPATLPMSPFRRRARDLSLKFDNSVTMNSSNSELETISSEINYLSVEMNKLLQRKKMLRLHQDMKRKLHFGHTEFDLYQQEVDQIDDKVEQLSSMEAELKKTFENLLSAENMKEEEEVNVELEEKTHVPDIPAPAVVLDVKNLPRCPCRIQCPECRQVIMTETISSVSDLAWLLCSSSASIGCVAGCCLIPFFLDRFKSITHKCPTCGTSIGTIGGF